MLYSVHLASCSSSLSLPPADYYTGQLFTYFPHESVSPFVLPEKRQRSASPPLARKQRQRRRRLFESFGMIPSLQGRDRHDGTGSDVETDVQEEDSDEVLNMPTMLLSRRASSR